MKPVVVFIALLAVCLAKDEVFVSHTGTDCDGGRLNPEDERHLCDAKQVDVELQTLGEYCHDGMNPEEVKDFIGDPTRTDKWTKVSQTHFADMDGRNGEQSLCTLGGDFGEFVRALNVFEKEFGEPLGLQEITTYFDTYLRDMSKEYFYMSTDKTSFDLMKGILVKQFPQMMSVNFTLECAPEYTQGGLLEMVVDPKFIGNQYIRKMVQNPEDFGIRAELVTDMIRAYFVASWKVHSGKDMFRVQILSGPHKERAIVSVYDPNQCSMNGFAMPLTPAHSHDSVFMYHASAVAHFREDLASTFGVLAKKGDAFRSEFQEKLDKEFKTHLDAHMKLYAGKNLPKYDVNIR